MTYAFDNRAKAGFARGEGAAALILKPLDQALKDNDKICSVIVNTGTNQDGRTVGMFIFPTIDRSSPVQVSHPQAALHKRR